MASQSKDIVIVGGSIVGSATAYYLANAGVVDGRRIIVIEKDPTYSLCSTARSAGGLRQQFSTPENVAMSQVTLNLIRRLQDTFGPDADVGFREQGYLLLASPNDADMLAANVKVQRKLGADIELLRQHELAARFPWLNIDGLACGSFGRSGEGWFDPVSLMNLFQRAARDAGIEYIHDTVIGVERSGHQAHAVKLASGKRVPCGAVVNAAGAWSGEVSALAGLHLPVEPRKRYVYVIDCRSAPDELHSAPLTADPTGVWFRPEGRMFLTGISPHETNEPAPLDLNDIDYDLFEEEVWPRLATRVPVFESIKVVNAWAGFYDYNAIDQNAIIGPHPELANFYFATGFSGHGLQHGAAAGRGISELILYGRFTTLDLTRFSYARISEGRPLFEQNVI